MDRFTVVTTALTLVVVWGAGCVLDAKSADSAFVPGTSAGHHLPEPRQPAGFADKASTARPVETLRESLGLPGLVAFGAGFGVLLAASRAKARDSRVLRRAADGEIEVAEKTETKPTLAWLDNIPRTILEKEVLDRLLATTPKEELENPPEESYIATLKSYSETYGEGKATKMGWWDFWYMKVSEPGLQDLPDPEAEEELRQIQYEMRKYGRIPLFLPGPAGWFPTGIKVQWRGPEPFAGDQVMTVVTDGNFSKKFIANWAFFREGLQPWQRGLEIGMAHGYFLIGPFVSLGPLRDTPEAATVGLLCGCAIVGLVSVGGLFFGSIMKPTLFDKKDEPEGSGFQSLINWHAVGGVGGAGFAHALLTIFGS